MGKIPPPYIGPSVWFDILRKSELNNSFSIDWFDVNVHKDFKTLGKGNFRNVVQNVLLYFRFRKSLIDHKPEIVLVPISQTTIGFLKDSIFIRMALKRSRVIVMLHGSNLGNWLNRASHLVRRYFSKTISHAEGAIVLGENLRHLFSPWFDESRIFSVPNGISLKKVPEYQEIKNRNGVVVLRYIGNLMKAKGIHEILGAMALLKSQKDVALHINGVWTDHVYRDYCEKFIIENNLPVRYDGPVEGDKKWQAYSDSDIFIFTPTKPEGLPFVIIEAMASGLPVITTDQGAIREAVKDNVNGFIVEPGNPGQIASRIKFLIDHPEKRIEMGNAGRQMHANYFSEKAMVNNYSNIFTKLLNDNKKGSAIESSWSS